MTRRFRLRPLPAIAALAWLVGLAGPAAGETGPSLDRNETAPAPASAQQNADEVVVTASRTARRRGESAVATAVIGAQRIRESGAQNLADLLEEFPGVWLSSSGVFGSGLELSGLPADYTLVLVDGMRGIGRINGVIDLSRFPIENIERVEIVRGPVSALYGSDAIGGAINIITRKTLTQREFGGTAGVGAFGTLDASVRGGVSSRNASNRLSVGYHRSDGFDRQPSDEATTQGAIDQVNASTTNTLALSKQLELAATAEYLYRDRRGVDLSAGGAVIDRQNATENGSILLSPLWRLSDNESLKLWGSLSLFRDQLLRDQRNGSALDDLQDTRERLVQTGAQFHATWGRHRPVLGFELIHEHLNTPRLSTGSGTRLRAAVYAQHEWLMAEPGPQGAGRLAVVPSGRIDLDSQFGTYSTPRLSLRYDPGARVTLRASAGVGFKAPDFRELYLLYQNPGAGYLVEGSAELKPERSQTVDGGIEFRINKKLTLEASAFATRLRERIATQLGDELDGTSRFIYANTGRARSAGINSQISLRPNSRMTLEVSHSFVLTRDDDTGQRLGGQPLHRASFSARYRLNSWGLNAFVQAALVGRRPFIQGDRRVDAAPYASIDTRLGKRLFDQLEGFLLAENLADAGDQQFLPIQPRTFSGGVRFGY